MSEAILRPSANVKQRIGQTWGRWTVIAFAGHNKWRQILWLCRCQCGTERVKTSGAVAAAIVNGNYQSCGCIRNEWTVRKNTTHGMSRSPEYVVWCGMRERCGNSNQGHFNNYGGRGIEVCERWLGSDGFVNFYADMGPRPSRKHTLERRNNDKGYCPENCLWATRKVQRRNQRNPRLRPLTFNGETLLVVEWAERLGVSKDALFTRLHRGWSVERTLTTPVVPQKRLTRAAPA